MKIVIDTNVLISGVFFGGFPRKILSAVVGKDEEIMQEMISRKQGHINKSILSPLIKNYGNY